jgi:diguanylate cyclase (GGDEF)-like protein
MRPSRPGHALFLVAIGAAGWTVAAAVLGAPGAWPPVAGAALFLALLLGARGFSFPLGTQTGGEAAISLDSALYIAAASCLGVRAGVLGVGLIMSGVAIGRVQKRRAGADGPLGRAAYVVYFGGQAAGLLGLWGRAFLDGGAHNAGVLRTLGLGGVFLASHYLVETVQLRLAGASWRASLRRNLTGAIAEAALLPLAGVIVLLWDPHALVPFALLGGTYLLVNWNFHRLALLAAELRGRVVELETLARTAHAAGASLELPQVLSSLLKETARALPAATRIEAVLARGDGGQPERYVARDGAAVVREPASALAAALARSREPTLDDDLRDEPGGVRSRATVPLIMYGEVLGALIAESGEPEAFDAHQLRLLEAISGQAATAVENARLYGLANIDGLTGLYCRRYFDVRIAEEIERARRFGTSFALVMLDLDDFKRLNDTHGHVAGDRALRDVAVIAASQLRGVDLAARYGGEELAFLLPRTSVIDAHAVAERIREAVATYPLVDGNGKPCRGVTASLGVAGWTESGEAAPSTLVARADAALYRAKASGKNRVEIDLISFELTPSLAPIRRRRA